MTDQSLRESCGVFHYNNNIIVSSGKALENGLVWQWLGLAMAWATRVQELKNFYSIKRSKLII